MHANKHHKPVAALGLMSGTSMDGVDVALIETDGETVHSFGPALERPFTPAEQALLRGALDDAQAMKARGARPGRLPAAEVMITEAYAQAIEDFMRKHKGERIDVIGLHGQTVLHRPQDRLTVQLIDAAALARRFALPVVHDLRGADVAAGGHGAPLVPVYHQALARAAALAPPVAVLNIGGVANVTWIGADDRLLAFDTGPGNAMLDDWVFQHTGEAMDRGGQMAKAGRTVAAALADLERHFSAYLAQKPPKSLDRLDFAPGRAAVENLSPGDGAATLVAFTARSLAASIAHMPAKPGTWIVTGGGAHNPAIMDALASALPGDVISAEALGWHTTFIEAQAFAFLAVRSLRGMPITFPGTTGVAQPLTGGHVIRPERAA